MSRSTASRLPLVYTRLTWGLFALSLGLLVWAPDPEWAGDGLLRADGLTRVMALVTTFVSGIVHSFSRRYMAGAKRLNAFYGRLFGLTLIVLVLTAANHLVLFGGAWAAMGWVLADLIGHVRGWPQARAAARYARQHFLGGSALLAGALGLLGGSAGAWTISGVLAAAEALPTLIVAGAAGLLLLAAMVQSALVPFHRWLLSSMTAPTPVSGFMHAGLVNAGGVLLARFAPVVFEAPAVMWAIVLAGGVSALLGQAWMLVQTDVKRQLGASTVAQMGFMVLQCGLGFVPAAIAHLILHGFYKAYLFLAAGSAVEHTTPGRPEASGTGALGGLVTAAAAVGGGALFAVLTGKSLTALNSGTVLTFFVVLAVLHATRTLVRRTSLSPAVRTALVPAVLLPTLVLYAGVYKGVGALFADVPSAVAPTALTPLHGALLAVFVGAYIAVDRGWHRASTRLYVTLRNTAQPLSTTLLNNRDQYNAH
ncbi:NAD(P)H-quinone oxidoreductase subunit 5 [Salinibacter ruber]|uniref:proton-conducting transporter transmembrane domain-containing protein n=1 Tax=Salinibacter ruber TaxID=146919 RepID=UPI002169B0F4|nr:proton-conducting transporter membrane subunit [Salinibacter ruber]MCS3633008.1 NAD(P)H-quinone oxidoreductase subunit 5 [Salinibacter ruber]MCS3713217.1 NAD(P)H-quinone oxidoreductase subunit 5 [Salinibacter ruber]